jgi:hypothetical protein
MDIFMLGIEIDSSQDVRDIGYSWVRRIEENDVSVSS